MFCQMQSLVTHIGLVEWQQLALFYNNAPIIPRTNNNYIVAVFLSVPGLTASRLNVEDSSNGPCDTNGESRNVWRNETLIALAPQCLPIQLE